MPALSVLDFLVLGDWGRRGAPGQAAVAAGMAMVASRVQPQFVVTTGDNFYEHGVSDCEDPHWRESFGEVYSSRALNVPWHPVLGNHDWCGNPAAQVEFSSSNLRWRMPGYYYEITYRLCDGSTLQLLFLDTTPLVSDYRSGGCYENPNVEAADADAQLAWLEATLRQSAPRHRIAIGHHPIASASPFHGNCPDLENQLLPLFQRHGVGTYLCGHEHDMQHLVSDGVHHVVCGAAAEVRESGRDSRTLYAAALPGFGAVRVSPAGILLRLHDQRGECLYEADIGQAPGGMRLVGS